jgi:flagellar hook protein FlgE
MTSALTTATAGLLSASNRLNQSANRVAKIGTDLPGAEDVDPATEIVNQIEAQDSFAMNASVVRASADMSKRLLDMLV